MISTSILGIKENINENLKQIDNTNTSYIHLDIMDSIFVNNSNEYKEEYKFYKKLDIHLMVKDIVKYIDIYKKLKPEFITFHLEATDDTLKIINMLKETNIKAGIAIKPTTTINEIIPYLKDIDLVLVMSVEPGMGGQSFIEYSTLKIDELKKIREENDYHYLIEVDGGINDKTISKVKNADIKVVGSFITNYDDYQQQINKLKKI